MNAAIRNIGILAHVDAGKTTITESLLFLSGKIKQKGAVDEGTAQTDFLHVEKERGITVQSANAYFDWNNLHINLIDTPGHVDFSADLERTMRIIDGAILVVSAVEGVQAHTLTIWQSLQEHAIPTIVFINKIDRLGADYELVLQELEKELLHTFIALQEVIHEGTDNAELKSLWNANFIDDTALEKLAELDEYILSKYLEGEPITFDDCHSRLKKLVQNNAITPVLFGSAKNNVGVGELMDLAVSFIPPPHSTESNQLSAFVHKIEHHQSLGKLAHVKILGGSIQNRNTVINQSQNSTEKITQIGKFHAQKFMQIQEATPGDIVVLCGLKTAQTGDILGENTIARKAVKLRNPLLTVQVKPTLEKDYFALAEALQILTEEDPALDFEWIKEDRELHVKIMGWIQIEVLEKILLDRFALQASFDDPTVIYKEKPQKTGEGFVQYWMPKPCWAIMKFHIEPGKPGSGVIYESKVSVDKIHQKYQNEVKRTIKDALKQGIKGWEVTDIKIALIDGEDHEIHSRPGDFVIATPMGIMNGLQNTGTSLLEPLISYKITAPEELLGAITSDIIQMRGTFDSPKVEKNKFIIHGILPVATSLDFPVRLSSRSGGKAKIATQFHGYQACSNELGVVRPYKGISPLDTAKYILKARKALQ